MKNNINQIDKKNLLILYLLAFLGLSLLISSISLSTGVFNIPITDVFSIVFSSNHSGTVSESIIYDIRLPRILLSFFVGISLSISGAVMQGLFRNPLADPSILGVSAGSALGAVIPISFAIHTIHLLVIPLFSFIGGMTASILVYLIFQVVLMECIHQSPICIYHLIHIAALSHEFQLYRLPESRKILLTYDDGLEL